MKTAPLCLALASFGLIGGFSLAQAQQSSALDQLAQQAGGGQNSAPKAAAVPVGHSASSRSSGDGSWNQRLTSAQMAHIYDIARCAWEFGVGTPAHPLSVMMAASGISFDVTLAGSPDGNGGYQVSSVQLSYAGDSLMPDAGLVRITPDGMVNYRDSLPGQASVNSSETSQTILFWATNPQYVGSSSDINWDFPKPGLQAVAVPADQMQKLNALKSMIQRQNKTTLLFHSPEFVENPDESLSLGPDGAIQMTGEADDQDAPDAAISENADGTGTAKIVIPPNNQGTLEVFYRKTWRADAVAARQSVAQNIQGWSALPIPLPSEYSFQ